MAETRSSEHDITIRPATAADQDRIVDFNLAMALETEGKHLSRDRLAAGVGAVLADPAKGFYLVARRANEVVGSLMVTTEWSDWRSGLFWWIQSVYVPLAHRGSGVFRALYDHVLAMARAEDEVCGVRLYVEKENGPAQKVYEAVGMRRTSYLFYEVEFEG